MRSRLAALILRLFGWQTLFGSPPGPKSVIVVYPHTSNWDFPIGILWRAKHGFPIHWAGKDTLFRGPFRRFFLWLGGIPINRRERTGMIGQLTEAFSTRPSFHLCITPEGTRAHTDHWKSGFYRLALAANVPIGLGFIDYGKKEAGVECWLTLTGNEAEDLEALRTYYADKRARYPEKAGDIRFRTQ